MATATFIKTKAMDTTDQIKSIALIQISDVIVEIDFWYSLLNQWSTEDVKLYLCAEALWKCNLQQDAIQLIAPFTLGSYEKETNVDTRNWQQNWLDGHMPESYLIEPVIDPLA